MPTKLDSFLTYGEAQGLNKLEVLTALEEVLRENNLHDQTFAKLDELGGKDEGIICEDCGRSLKDGESHESELDGALLCAPCYELG